MALASVLVPWLLYPTVGGHVADALTPAALLEALWPVLIGAALAPGLWLWGNRLPRVPEGDIIVAGEAAFCASYAFGAALERMDARLRQWPAAGLARQWERWRRPAGGGSGAAVGTLAPTGVKTPTGRPAHPTKTQQAKITVARRMVPQRDESSTSSSRLPIALIIQVSRTHARLSAAYQRLVLRPKYGP
jgi:hypothetical protein